ncbi:MAG TPA: hypothetical protein VHD63_16225 [Ktedonobacteraceae bacterium]|nr:hypothetical protein [Ktedonobacteraceae bacterium]
MSSRSDKQKHLPHNDAWDDEEESDEYSEMERLEMLESLREDMEELGVSTLEEVIARIEELHRRLDAR